jgi:hypothetical protein
MKMMILFMALLALSGLVDLLRRCHASLPRWYRRLGVYCCPSYLLSRIAVAPTGYGPADADRASLGIKAAERVPFTGKSG